MFYSFSKEKINRIKLEIPKVEDKIRIWQKEKEKATLDRKKLPDKYYKNITERIKYSDQMIEKYQGLLSEFKDAIAKSGVEI